MAARWWLFEQKGVGWGHVTTASRRHVLVKSCLFQSSKQLNQPTMGDRGADSGGPKDGDESLAAAGPLYLKTPLSEHLCASVGVYVTNVGSGESCV